jgi:hypothetical protein
MAMLGQEDKGRLRASHELLGGEEICAGEKGKWRQRSMTFKGHRGGMGWGGGVGTGPVWHHADRRWRGDPLVAVVGSDPLPARLSARKGRDMGC